MPDDVRPFHHGGATLIVEDRGAGQETFVLVHGIGMGRGVFADLVEQLLPHGRVIAVDLPGYGDAPEPERTPTIERMADLVAAMLRDRGLDDPVLIGHSMGTQVVVEVAARHPTLTSRVVLAAPTVNDRARRAFTQLRLLAADLRGEGFKVLFLGAREYLRAGPNLRRKLRAMLAHRPELSYPRIRARALVLRGEHDLVCPTDWCERVTLAIPTAAFEVVPECGHETMIDDARPVAARVREWSRER